MPIGLYYKGSGVRVYREMRKRYGKKKGKEIFYATANNRGLAPKKAKHG